jgi:hypothetical protein
MLRLTLLAAALLIATPAVAQKLEAMPDLTTGPVDSGRYYRCLDQAAKEPEQNFEDAMQWRDTSGSNAARHCVAVTLFHLGQPAVAATRLEELGIEMRAAPQDLRARILSQAATAWLAAATTGIEISPRLPDLYVDRALVLAQAQS